MNARIARRASLLLMCGVMAAGVQGNAGVRPLPITCTAAGTWTVENFKINPGLLSFTSGLEIAGQGSCTGGFFGPQHVALEGGGLECFDPFEPCATDDLSVTLTLTNVVTGTTASLGQIWTGLGSVGGLEPIIVSSFGRPPYGRGAGAGVVRIGPSSPACSDPRALRDCHGAYFVWDFTS